LIVPDALSLESLGVDQILIGPLLYRLGVQSLLIELLGFDSFLFERFCRLDALTL